MQKREKTFKSPKQVRAGVDKVDQRERQPQQEEYDEEGRFSISPRWQELLIAAEKPFDCVVQREENEGEENQSVQRLSTLLGGTAL